MRPAAKALGIALPVLISTTFCLTVPTIFLLANTAILVGAVWAYMMESGVPVLQRKTITEFK